jgi:glycosyltransferase involved in cell wall biosynthesis
VTDTWLFVHSSDELFGADRVLLDVLDAMPSGLASQAVVMLPNDLAHSEYPLCEVLRARGIQYHHVSLPIIRRANLNPRGVRASAQCVADFRKRLRLLSPAVIYGTTSATLLALASAPTSSARIIFHNQEIWKPAEAPILGTFAGRTNLILANSNATRGAEPKHLQRRTTVVPNTTPDQMTLSTYRPLSSIATTPLQFVTAGRWTPTKGFDVLLDAWARYAPGDLRIAGAPPPSGIGLDLALQRESHPHRASIELVGKVDSISGLINSGHVVLMPSRNPESFGLVALEAMSAGRPVIASRIGGLAEVVTEDVGWLVEPGDVRSLTRVLEGITLAEIKHKGANARRRYEEHFSQDAFRRNWLRAANVH